MMTRPRSRSPGPYGPYGGPYGPRPPAGGMRSNYAVKTAGKPGKARKTGDI